MSRRAPALTRLPARRRPAAIGMTVAFVVVGALALIPFWAMLVGTFQDGEMLIRYGLNLGLDPANAHLRNYVMLFTDSGPYFTWFANSIVLTVIQVVGTLLISAFVAYGFAMYDFRFKTTLFILVVVLMTIPFEMLMLPLYVQTNAMGLSDNYAAILLPFLAQAMTIFFFRQYLVGIPREILEAGRVDGVTEFGIFFRLVVPLMKPAFAAMAILNGMASWNNFLWPLLVLRSPEKYTLPIGLNTLLTPYGNNYSLLIVGAFFSLIPILLLFLAFQRFFIQGMTAGAVKG
ncbi:Monosaccharide-transporting ATPase [Xylanimonas cellulosilytica DSM 15894]|uniref:Monosaccharide-transporting ATPase n=1 Tax=Xylanimonas cellulosilytica (strain DSM 15894 / JCM 12276 / CECT 5975 / KCTC 9989 / LMG 20990 / NBRC 107835 / XIL07) TaxID=446471 RepID=D1BVH8_XYLCX|nr:carbohydrate ABC transporter permease [Xylanimonas cellulosilytica]ACZ29449.1 Monosaccharide-transporting ATPase [Xylanimonas cellulosilytica DSM 15894]